MKNLGSILLLLLFLNVRASTSYPKDWKPMLGEQIDLIGVESVSLLLNQSESTPVLIGNYNIKILPTLPLKIYFKNVMIDAQVRLYDGSSYPSRVLIVIISTG